MKQNEKEAGIETNRETETETNTQTYLLSKIGINTKIYLLT